MKRVKAFFTDFKKFISKGNIIDLAVGVIIGSSFSAIVTSLTNKIIMPFINYLLSLGGNGLESAYTFLKKVYVVDSAGNPTNNIDLTKSIYIDWGAFITAIINFFIIAFVLFLIVRIFMKARGYVNKAIKDTPNRSERKELKAMGVNMKNYSEVVKATRELRESKKPAPVPPKPTQEQLLAEILEELKKSNKDKEENIKIEE